MVAAKVSAVIGPTPGTVISNWTTDEVSASRTISSSKRLIWIFRASALAISGSIIAFKSGRAFNADRTRLSNSGSAVKLFRTFLLSFTGNTVVSEVFTDGFAGWLHHSAL